MEKLPDSAAFPASRRCTRAGDEVQLVFAVLFYATPRSCTDGLRNRGNPDPCEYQILVLDTSTGLERPQLKNPARS